MTKERIGRARVGWWPAAVAMASVLLLGATLSHASGSAVQTVRMTVTPAVAFESLPAGLAAPTGGPSQDGASGGQVAPHFRCALAGRNDGSYLVTAGSGKVGWSLPAVAGNPVAGSAHGGSPIVLTLTEAS